MLRGICLSPIALRATIAFCVFFCAPVADAQQRVEMALIDDVGMNEPVDAIKQQLRGELTVELGFIRRAVRPTPEQKEEILKIAEECLDEMAKSQQKPPQRAQLRGGFIVRNGRIQRDEGAANLQQRLKERLRPLLEQEQWQRYRDEYERRESFREQVVVDHVVASYEQRLGITSDQSEAIRQSLQNDWTIGPNIKLETLVRNSQYFPSLPDSLVVPHLNEDQKKVYQSVPKLSLTPTGRNQAVAIFEEDFWEVSP